MTFSFYKQNVIYQAETPNIFWFQFFFSYVRSWKYFLCFVICWSLGFVFGPIEQVILILLLALQQFFRLNNGLFEKGFEKNHY